MHADCYHSRIYKKRESIREIKGEQVIVNKARNVLPIWGHGLRQSNSVAHEELGVTFLRRLLSMIYRCISFSLMQLMMFYVTTYENEQFFCLKQLPPLAEIFIDTIKENENLQTGRVFFSVHCDWTRERR